MEHFAGFAVIIGTTFMGEAQVILKGGAHHSTRLQATAVGTMRSVEHLVASQEDSLAQTMNHLAQCRRRSEDLQVQAGQTFEYAEKLTALA